ncbi:NYN domain-containing protein [Pelagibacterium montanilacus]|uniref:NYN domain-containing protein n=1 Tax=Pelagibacterium montanilacus TaxID=2185280 RepID=UPI000F8F35EA|nr:NYN domain-containing protein [Pelagibacterium montanilacus]
MDETFSAVLLVDGSHYDRLRSTFGTRIDFFRLVPLLSAPEGLMEIRYYRDVRDRAEMARFAGFRAWLETHDISVVGRAEPLDPPAPRQRYGTNLLELAVDAQRCAEKGKSIFVLAGDFQLTPVVAGIRQRGASVAIVSTLFAPASIAPHRSLLDAADRFIELRDLLPEISMD